MEIQLVEAWVEQWTLEAVGLSVVGSTRRSAAATTESEPETEPVAVRLGELVGVSEISFVDWTSYALLILVEGQPMAP